MVVCVCVHSQRREMVQAERDSALATIRQMQADSEAATQATESTMQRLVRSPFVISFRSFTRPRVDVFVCG